MLKYILSMLICLVPVMGFAEDFEAGKDYIILKNYPKNEPAHHAVSVTEFFSYGCPWCYRLEPVLNQWVAQQGAAISYNKVPVIFNKDWEYYAKAYYTAVALGMEPQLTPVLFKAILKDKQSLNSNKAMIDFFIQHGVDTATATSAFNHSASIDIALNEGNRKMAQYQISAVPALVVNNQYKTDLQMAKSQDRLLEILNFLVSQANKPGALKTAS